MARKRKKNNSGSSILQNLMRDVKAKTGFTRTLVNPEGEISISDAISKIIAPYRDTAQDYEPFRKLVTVTCAAWNAAILPVEKRESMLADMRKLMPDQQSREDFTEIVKELMKRKNRRSCGVTSWPSIKLVRCCHPARRPRLNLRECLKTRQNGESRANLRDDQIQPSLPDRSE